MKAGVFTGIGIAGGVGLVAALLTWTRPGDPTLYPAPAGQAPVSIYLLDNGFHTDLALPRAALEARPGPLAEAVATLEVGDWVLVGWGDAKFYVDQSPIQGRLPDGARAFFRPGNASVVMLDPEAVGAAELPDQEGQARVRLSHAGFDALADHIQASLALKDDHAVLAARRTGAAGPDDARFFASREHFSVLHLCNHWAAGALNAAGLPVRPVRSITSAEVMATAARADRDQSSMPSTT